MSTIFRNMWVGFALNHTITTFYSEHCLTIQDFNLAKQVHVHSSFTNHISFIEEACDFIGVRR